MGKGNSFYEQVESFFYTLNPLLGLKITEYKI